MDAFIYSNKLSKYSGTTYSGLMHVTDWFPTMLTMANIKFTPSAGMELDGVDQSDAMKLGDKYNARETMVYNMYMNVDDEDFDIYTNSNVAVRNKQFKLIHAYTDNYCADWYTVSEESDNDDNVAYNGYNYCGQTQSLEGNYVTMLFDLVNDPYETTDLFSDSAYASVKVCGLIFDLYILILIYFRLSCMESLKSTHPQSYRTTTTLVSLLDHFRTGRATITLFNPSRLILVIQVVLRGVMPRTSCLLLYKCFDCLDKRDCKNVH